MRPQPELRNPLIALAQAMCPSPASNVNATSLSLLLIPPPWLDPPNHDLDVGINKRDPLMRKILRRNQLVISARADCARDLLLFGNYSSLCHAASDAEGP